MNCRYCGSINDASDHRCLRCGRRLQTSSAVSAPDVYPVSGSRALAPEPKAWLPDAAPAGSDDVPVPETKRRAPYQPTLFTSRDLGRVVPIEAYQARAAERRARAQSNESGPARPRSGATEPANDLQTALPFTAPTAPARTAKAASLARHSKAPVAIPVHRMMAAAIDFSMVMVGAGGLAAVVYLWLGSIVLPGHPLHWFTGTAFVLGVLYKALWALAGLDSPGLRWCHLRLLNFDGVEPRRSERLRRVAWSLMSILPGGLGLVWSLVDEETLSWHDHSSKTFLTSFSAAAQR